MSEPQTIETNEAPRQKMTLFGAILRATSFIIAWWAFTEGNWREWGVAVAVIVAATLASFHILPLRSWQWSLRGLIAFMPYFLWQSFLGGLDVAWRAFHPRLPLDPGLQAFETRLPGQLPRVFLAWTISLLPGTASVTLEEQHLTIHVLNQDDQFSPKMIDLENRIGRIFGV